MVLHAAAQAYPYPGSTAALAYRAHETNDPYTWPAEFNAEPLPADAALLSGTGVVDGTGDDAAALAVDVAPGPVPMVWEDVSENGLSSIRLLKRIPDYGVCFQGF